MFLLFLIVTRETLGTGFRPSFRIALRLFFSLRDCLEPPARTSRFWRDERVERLRGQSRVPNEKATTDRRDRLQRTSTTSERVRSPRAKRTDVFGSRASPVGPRGIARDGRRQPHTRGLERRLRPRAKGADVGGSTRERLLDPRAWSSSTLTLVVDSCQWRSLGCGRARVSGRTLFLLAVRIFLLTLVVVVDLLFVRSGGVSVSVAFGSDGCPSSERRE